MKRVGITLVLLGAFFSIISGLTILFLSTTLGMDLGGARAIGFNSQFNGYFLIVLGFLALMTCCLIFTLSNMSGKIAFVASIALMFLTSFYDFGNGAVCFRYQAYGGIFGHIFEQVGGSLFFIIGVVTTVLAIWSVRQLNCFLPFSLVIGIVHPYIASFSASFCSISSRITFLLLTAIGILLIGFSLYGSTSILVNAKKKGLKNLEESKKA